MVTYSGAVIQAPPPKAVHLDPPTFVQRAIVTQWPLQINKNMQLPPGERQSSTTGAFVNLQAIKKYPIGKLWV